MLSPIDQTLFQAVRRYLARIILASSARQPSPWCRTRSGLISNSMISGKSISNWERRSTESITESTSEANVTWLVSLDAAGGILWQQSLGSGHFDDQRTVTSLAFGIQASRAEQRAQHDAAVARSVNALANTS